MGRILFVLLLMGSWFVCACVDHTAIAAEELIPVKPGYAEAASEAQSLKNAAENQAIPEPTPRDQMYLFWILGKIISYPVDKAESFITGQVQRLRNRPVATPASAPADSNPFESVNWREIPPAPPANSAAGSRKGSN